jgi:SAM-dependent methyltransferase
VSSQRRKADSHRHSFDAQAREFDRRAGLPAIVAQEIAQAIVGMVEPSSEGDTILELGAGTGQIGSDLAASASVRYIGLDLSQPMLVEFRNKLAANVALVQADANLDWPIASQSIRAIFLARSLHLLSVERVAEQALRVNAGNARILVGGVKRIGDSLREQMRDRMRSLLGEQGMQGRGRGSAAKKLFSVLTSRGATPQPTVIAAEWAVTERPRDSLDSWEQKDGLAGVDIPAATKHHILDSLRVWAQEQYGDLDSVRRSTEQYEIQILHLP